MIYAPVTDSGKDAATLSVAEFRGAISAMRANNSAAAIQHLAAARLAALKAAERATEAIETLKQARKE